jgi:endonuclease G
MCPAGDNKWDNDAMYDTFLYSNVCPQHPRLNSGDWNEIEIACRRWAQNFNDIYIICGPIYFRKEHQTIGANRIMVPDAFFKVVICLNGTPKGIGFICRNTEGNRRKDMYVNSISQVERITGMNFFPNLPSDISFMVKNGADIKSWDMP